MQKPVDPDSKILINLTCICCYHQYVTRFAETQHNDAVLEIHIFALVSSIYPKFRSAATAMLYCKYFSSYKAR